MDVPHFDLIILEGAVVLGLLLILVVVADVAGIDLKGIR